MFPQLGMMEMIVVMGVAVLLFGKRLPEVGRSMGKGIVEFKKGLRGIEEEFSSGSDESTSSYARNRHDDPATLMATSAPAPAAAELAVPKFEPPTMPPVHQMDAPVPPTHA